MSGKSTKKGGRKNARQSRQMGVVGLSIALVAIVVGGILFIGAISGWFDDKTMIVDAEYYNTDTVGLVDLPVSEYNKLIDDKKSFMVFVDQGGCTTADRLRGYVEKVARERNMKVYKMMFSEMKESSLHDYVKHYPSVALISHGKPVVWLRADSDEDADAYNDENAFRGWLNKYLK